MPPKTPAISRAVIKPPISTTALTAQDIRAVMRNNEWIPVESRNPQLMYIEQLAKTECGITFDTTVPAELFELTHFCVRAIRAKAQRKQQPPYCPPAVSDEHEFELCQMIRDKAVTSSYVTKRVLINYIETNLRISLTYGSIVSCSVGQIM
jgi:hypothetical protein